MSYLCETRDVTGEQCIAVAAHVPVTGVNRLDAHTTALDLLVVDARGEFRVQRAQSVQNICAVLQM